MGSRYYRKQFNGALRRLLINPDSKNKKSSCWEAWRNGIAPQYVTKRARQLLCSRSLKAQLTGCIIASFHNEEYGCFDDGLFDLLLAKLKPGQSPRLLVCILRHMYKCKVITVPILERLEWVLDHPSPEVRYALTWILEGNEPIVGNYLLKLMADSHPKVRDWATFTMAEYTELDSDAVLEAFIRNASDQDEDVRHEAITGLAKRKCPAVAPFIMREIDNCTDSNLIYEAIEMFPLPEYHDILEPLMSLRCSLGSAPLHLCRVCAARKRAWEAVLDIMKAL